MTADSVKTPFDTIPLEFDFSDWTTFTEHPITSADFSESDAGITIGTPEVSGNIVKVVVSGGTADTVYKLVCRVLTGSQPRAERTKRIAIVEEL